jgi:hypothetical protein
MKSELDASSQGCPKRLKKNSKKYALLTKNGEKNITEN